MHEKLIFRVCQKEQYSSFSYGGFKVLLPFCLCGDNFQLLSEIWTTNHIKEFTSHQISWCNVFLHHFALNKFSSTFFLMIVVKSNDSIFNAFVGYFGLDAILISVAVLVILVASCIYCYRRIYRHYGMYDNGSKL